MTHLKVLRVLKFKANDTALHPRRRGFVSPCFYDLYSVKFVEH
jgi:hypothetical protein